MTQTVKLKAGQVIVMRPTAGIRNNAMVKAETSEGIRQTMFMVELIPHCIVSHPWGVRPIKQCLDSLDVEEYDMIVDAMAKLLGGGSDKEKKSEPSQEKSPV